MKLWRRKSTPGQSRGESVRGTDRNCKLFLENVSVQLSDFACCFWDLRKQRLTKSSKKGWGSSMSSLVANQESWIKSKGKHGTSQDGQKPMAFRHLIYLDLIKAFDKHDLVVWQKNVSLLIYRDRYLSGGYGDERLVWVKGVQPNEWRHSSNTVGLLDSSVSPGSVCPSCATAARIPYLLCWSILFCLGTPIPSYSIDWLIISPTKSHLFPGSYSTSTQPRRTKWLLSWWKNRKRSPAISDKPLQFHSFSQYFRM